MVDFSQWRPVGHIWVYWGTGLEGKPWSHWTTLSEDLKRTEIHTSLKAAEAAAKKLWQFDDSKTVIPQRRDDSQGVCYTRRLFSYLEHQKGGGK
jgi:hypothetical protein